MRIYCLALTVLLSACSTSYGPGTDSNGFGYADRKIESDRYAIQVKVNNISDKADARNFFDKRASELCGGARYEIVRIKEDSVKMTSRGVLGENVYDFPFVDGEVRCIK